MLINKLAIIGVGLIGSSLSRALQEAGACRHVTGYDLDAENLETALRLGVIHECSADLEQVISGAEVIVLATPLSSFADLLPQIARYASPQAVITDVGSVKQCVVENARASLGHQSIMFVPGHPIAGNERSGAEAGFPGLFRDHLVILTPLPENSAENVTLVTSMWQACGAHVIALDVDYHDRVLAATSHLPHVLAYALVDCLASLTEHDDIFRFSAGGFRDFTRIASSNPQMWSDICMANSENVLRLIADYRNHLDGIATLVETGDKQGLQSLFTQVKVTRDQALSQVLARQDDQATE